MRSLSEALLTTNYDTVLEAALSDKKIEAEREERQIRPIDVMPLVIGQDAPSLIQEFLLARHNDPHIPQRIAHLHGLHRSQESIILSSENYVEKYGLRIKKNGEDQGNEYSRTIHRKLLEAVLATRRVVFVGFSMEDPYFNKILEIVSADFWGWNKCIHYAIMGISTENKEDSQDGKNKADILKSKYGIDTVFYKILENEIPEKRHKLLESLFADIAKQCEKKDQSVSETQDLPDDTDRPKGEDPSSVKSGSRDVLNWLKREGQRIIRRISNED